MKIQISKENKGNLVPFNGDLAGHLKVPITANLCTISHALVMWYHADLQLFSPLTLLSQAVITGFKGHKGVPLAFQFYPSYSDFSIPNLDFYKVYK